jgi:hypothetical protein
MNLVYRIYLNYQNQLVFKYFILGCKFPSARKHKQMNINSLSPYAADRNVDLFMKGYSHYVEINYLSFYFIKYEPGSSVSTVTLGCTSRVRFPAGAGFLSSPHHRLQTGSGVHPASYLVGTAGSFPGVTTAGS